jgi:hypothetical protein
MRNENSELMVTLTIEELEDLLYKYTRIANDQLYKGLANHIFSIQDQLRDIEKTVEYLKVCQQVKPRRKKKVEENNED